MAAAHRFFDGFWDNGNLGATEALLAADFVSHNAAGQPPVGAGELIAAVRTLP
jgi:hypothetical protein